MKTSPVRYITDDSGRKTSVVVSMAAWKRLMAQLEELEDIKAYDEAKGRKEDSMPLESWLASRKK